MDASAPSDGSIVIAGYRANYIISKAQDTSIVTLTNTVTGDVQSYQSPPLIKFVDKYTSFDVAGPAGQVYRLYQAAFNRKPDLPGLGFWIDATEHGHTIQSIAGEFLTSSEFKTLYGDNASADVFITAMYTNVLHRTPDQDGYSWWVNAVNNGADRAGVVVGFSESAENEANVNPNLIGGFDFVPYTLIIQTQSTCAGNYARLYAGNYVSMNNSWGQANIANYTQCVSVLSTPDPTLVQTSWNWDWTASTNFSVKAYPEIFYGWKPGEAKTTVATMPVKVTDTDALTVFMDASVVSSGSYDLALDIWLTANATPSWATTVDEVMIWTQHSPDLNPPGQITGSVTVSGIVFDAYTGTTLPANSLQPAWRYAAFVARGNQSQIILPIKPFMDYLLVNNLIGSTEYLASIEVGNEIVNGKGSTTLTNFSITQ